MSHTAAADTAEAEELHRACTVVDLHADTPYLMCLGYDIAARHEPPLPEDSLAFHLDLSRARQGGLGAQFFGLISPSHRWMRPATLVDWQLNALDRAAAHSPDRFVLCRDATQVREARAAGKLAGLRGIEGAHALQGDLLRVEHFAGRGVAYLGLLHFVDNEAGAPAHGRGRDDALGLTGFGRQLVDELNRLRVIVDLAHINRRGFLEAAARSRRPVIVSHTGVLGVHRHWRNIDDDQIRAVAESGGCIGIIFSRRFLGQAGIDGVCAHLEHVIDVGGDDTPALGSDFDGFVRPPLGLADVRGLPNLTAALLRRGHPIERVQRILGENALRVLREVRGG